MTLIHMPSSATAEEAAACVKEHGYVIIDERASPELMDQAQAELAPHLEKITFGTSEITGRRTQRAGRLVARSAAARQIIMDPLVLGVVRRCLSASQSFQISLTEVISLAPGAAAQFIHRDGIAGGLIADDYETQISTLWAMTDYTEEMGATRVVPDSQNLPAGLKFTVEDTFPAVMKRGSVLVYSGRLYHGGGENRSRRTRQAMNIDYSVGWLRQEENQYLSCPQELARTLSPELLRLMGYDTHMSFGRVGDWLDPLSFLHGKEERLDEEALFQNMGNA